VCQGCAAVFVQQEFVSPKLYYDKPHTFRGASVYLRRICINPPTQFTLVEVEATFIIFKDVRDRQKKRFKMPTEHYTSPEPTYIFIS
jgi:hypothetical protein